MNEQKKLREAQYFLEQMQRTEMHDDVETFGFLFSAYLSAARSVLQYASSAAVKSRRQQWYDKHFGNSKWCKCFKEIRDGNIHERPPIQDLKETHHINGEFKFAGGIVRDIRVGHGGTMNGAYLERVTELDENGQTNGTTTRYMVTFTEGRILLNEPLIDACEEYLKDIDGIVMDGMQEGVLTLET